MKQGHHRFSEAWRGVVVAIDVIYVTWRREQAQIESEGCGKRKEGPYPHHRYLYA